MAHLIVLRVILDVLTLFFAVTVLYCGLHSFYICIGSKMYIGNELQFMNYVYFNFFLSIEIFGRRSFGMAKKRGKTDQARLFVFQYYKRVTTCIYTKYQTVRVFLRRAIPLAPSTVSRIRVNFCGFIP